MKKELIAYKDPKSPVSEMFRTLRTNLQFMNTDDELKTILITSTLPGEGKSWIASNLAVTFAQTGKSVVLIDGDMRKGRQYTIFDVLPRPGLSNYLSGVINDHKNRKTDGIEEFIQETDIENLSVISAGNVPPNPSELLVSHKMTKLINELNDMYDIIIFDGTPSLLVTDAIILSRLVDMTLLITAHKETKVDNIDKVKRTIENVGGKVAGVVVNKIPTSSKKYQDTYYYGNNKKKSNKKKESRKKKTIEKSISLDTVIPKEKSLPKIKPEIQPEISLKENIDIPKVEIPKIDNNINVKEAKQDIQEDKSKEYKEDIHVQDIYNENLDNIEKKLNEDKEDIIQNEVLPGIEDKLKENELTKEENQLQKNNIQENNFEDRRKNPPKPKTARRRKNQIGDTKVRRTIRTVQTDDIDTINNIIEETMSGSKRKKKNKSPDRSKDILNQINRYLDKQ